MKVNDNFERRGYEPAMPTSRVPVAPPPPPSRGTRPAIEHRTARMERDAELDQFGSEGWELVSVIPDVCDPSMAFFYFRRRR